MFRKGMLLPLLLFPTIALGEILPMQLELKGRKDGERVVYGVDLANGQIAWERRFGDEVNFVEKVKGGFLVGTDDGFLTLLDPEKGEVIWNLKLGKKVNTFRGEVAGGFLVSFHDEVLWLVSGKGELVWSLR